MPMTPIEGPFAYLLTPFGVEFLADEVSPEEWSKSKDEMEKLSELTHPEYGTPYMYVLFLDPHNRTLGHVTDSITLYEKYETKFYNEEILLIRPKKK